MYPDRRKRLRLLLRANATSAKRTGTSVASFTGNAGRADRSFGGSLVALLGVVAALYMRWSFLRNVR